MYKRRAKYHILDQQGKKMRGCKYCLDYSERLMYVSADMMRLVVILVGIVWASLLLISWSGAGEQPVGQESSVASSSR